MLLAGGRYRLTAPSHTLSPPPCIYFSLFLSKTKVENQMLILNIDILSVIWSIYLLILIV